MLFYTVLVFTGLPYIMEFEILVKKSWNFEHKLWNFLESFTYFEEISQH